MKNEQSVNMKYKLYSSDGCHLCEQALAIISPVLGQQTLAIIDIVEDEKLVELYGTSIPVLERVSDGEKLFWPFNVENVVELS